ncbi:Protein CBG07184 [Caenorhabditis briggsae]|uniref:L-serine deaminase n=1 Tax=Caenorhabditis briggsae TaxID=6238 RepID=A8X3I8_CAEBR|nr:Protein CBG07184 [Caenorhabditis briggsae]CAP27198.2 Protein CBG07184 [Caenorhabditis briggsae]
MAHHRIQDTGSFKERGARYALQNLTEEKRKNGVFAASAGNHALALSLHGRQLGIVCEGAGAIGIGAILSGKLDYLKGKTVVSILSGGNIDSTSLGRCIERGLAYDHRVIRLSVIIPDKPGGLSKLTGLVGDLQGNVRDLYLERAFMRNDMSSQRVKMVIEVRGKEHEEQLKEKLEKEYDPSNCQFKNSSRLAGL